MKKLTLVGTALVLSNLLSAQIQQAPAQSLHHHEVEKCSQHIKQAEMMQNDPARFATMMTDPLPNQPAKYKPTTQNEKLTGLVYKIPVVFHIIHNNGTENISDAQIQDQLNILNRDYRKLNADTSAVVAAFQSNIADVEIEFVFATIAPNGACFNGITRTVSSITSNGSDGQAQVNAVVAGNNVYQGVWAHNRYLNIYVCDDIGGAAGYTFNPNGGSTANATNMYYNGIFMLHDYTGSIGTSNTTNSRALTHEVGHWLNLSHVWGANNNPGSAGCSGTDNVNDTPATQGSTSCNLTANTCSTVDAYYGFDQIDNVQNYMDYSYCSKMFTQGQVDRMRAAMVSSTGGRSNIWTTANLNLVGGVPGGSLCAMDFTATDVALCAGDQTTFTMSAGGAPITSYSWTFTGGTPSSSTAASPTVTYSTPGTYQVSLTVVSGGNSYTKTKTTYISVAGGSLVSLPITEGFTAGTIPFTNWTLVNAAPTALTWTRNTSVGYNSTNSARLDNYSGANAGDDEMGLPNFSAASLSSLTMEFDVAYRPYDATYYDGLQVLASGDCGATYTTVYDKSNLVLATVGSATTSGFVPSGNSQWRHETIDLSSFAGSSRVILRMKAISGNGNYMYIDNINITGITSNTPPVAGFTSSVTTVCAGQTVTFTNSSTGSGNSYSWSFPGGTPSSSTATSPTITYSTAGTYNVSLQATNGNGSNTATQNNSITVNAIPSAPTITPGGPTTFCQGGNVVLTSSAGSGNTWSNSSTGTTLTASTSGTYTVTQTVSGCVSPASSAVTVTVNPNPTVTFGSVTQLCVYDDPITLTQGSPAGGTYSGTGVSGNQFDPAVAGSGNEVLTYSFTNGNGCSGSAQTTVVISDCLGVEDAGNITLNIYPNPSEGNFTIVANETVVSALVYDQSGKLVKEIKGQSVNEVAVDLTSFAGGVYTVKVITESSAKSVPVMLMK